MMGGMSLPRVAIVGRPNVGKSSLLNALARERVSIIDPRAGITRDRVSVIVEHQQRYFEVLDTGGIGLVDADHLEELVERQIQVALDQAAVIVFVVDVSAGLTPLDQAVAERLRSSGKPVVLVANKVDDSKHEPEAAVFYRLGYGEPLCLSALHGRGRSALLDRLVSLLGSPTTPPPEPVMRLAIVGKRNAGKSTLVNVLAGEERMIVSETPGTTRDAVDVRFERDGQTFVAIDTAGVRKKSSMSDIDFYSYTRALASIRRADVVMLLIDALVPVAEVDLKLARAVLDEYKPVVIAVNKWDLACQQAKAEDFGEYLTRVLPALNFAPIVFMAARSGHNVDAAIEVARGLHRQARTRLSTGRLNRVLRSILTQRGPSPRRGVKPVKIYYATQVAVAPPTIVLFSNDPTLVRPEYERFLLNRLRQMTPFKEIPVRLWFRRHAGGRATE